MANPLRIDVTGVFRDRVSSGIRNALKNLKVENSNTFKQMNNDVKRSQKQFGRLRAVVHETAKSINATLGGRVMNAAGQMNNLGQNISSISNRLGFMAFQWNFMANAAQRAVQTVLGGLTQIITAGAQMGDSLTRALAFGTEAQGIRDMTDSAKQDISELRDAIFKEGSGQNIFGIDEISNVARELTKAFPDPTDTRNVLPFVAQLKTLEPTLSDEKIGSGLASLFATLGTNTKDVNEIAAAMDFLSNVSDRSTANFQSSIASLGVASQQAKQIGITAFETGAIIQQVSDVLARNVGGGRASATAGVYANAFFRDLNKIADAESKQGSFARFVNLDIFDTVNGKKEFKDLVGIVEEFRNKFGKLSNADRAAQLSQLGLTENSQKTLNALLVKSGAELRDQIELLKERGVLEARAAATATSAQAQISRIQAAVNSLKITISDGFAPALFEIANQMSAIASAPEFRELMADIGKIMSKLLIPAIKTAFKFLKLFLGFLAKNKKTLRIAVGGVLALVGALVALQIIATIGFFALVAGASIAGMTGQMFLAAGAAATLRAGLSLVFKSMIPMALAGLGLALVALSLTDIFDKQLQPAIFGVGTAITALGAGLLFPTQSFKLLKSAVTALPKALGAIATAAVGGTEGFKLLGKDIAKSFTGSFDRAAKTAINTPDFAGGGGLLKTLRANKLPVIGIAIAIGAAFALWLNNAVQKSPVFQGGLVGYWDEAGFQLKAAIGKTLRAIRDAFLKIGSFIFDIFKGIADTAGKILNTLFEALSNPFDPAGWERLRDAVNSIFDPEGIKTFFAELSNPNVLALNRLKEVFGNFRKQLEAGTIDQSVLEGDSVRKIIASIQETAGSDLPLQEVIDAVNEGFGGDLLSRITGPLQEGANAFDVKEFFDLNEAVSRAAGGLTGVNEEIERTVAELQAQAGITDEITKSSEKIVKTGKDIATNSGKYLVSIKDGVAVLDKTNLNERLASEATKIRTSSTQDSTKELNVNADTLKTDTGTLIEKIDLQKLQVLEIAKNINFMSEQSRLILNVNVMWARLIGEGNRAAGKLASLKVSKSGKFSISDPGISGSDSQGIFNAQQLLNGFEQTHIDLDKLQEKLNQLSVQIAAQNAARAASSSSLPFDVIGNFGGARGASAHILTNGEQTVIDINVDGTFDINVEQGGLTSEQILELQEQIGESLTNAIKNQLGVQTV